jgi:aminopeptidase N
MPAAMARLTWFDEAMTRLRCVPLFVVAAMVLAIPLSATAAPAPGAPGAGDPYFPTQGNGGYDAQSYQLRVTFTPADEQLSGTAHITAVATQDLSRFDLDLRHNLRVSAVSVNGSAAAWAQPAATEQELVITPSAAIAKRSTFTVDVVYAGRVRPVIDPDGSLDGFIPTSDGAFVASEPQGSPSWYPVNDTPADKARFDVSMTVPSDLVAVGNGSLRSVRHHATTTTWRWVLGQSVSSYLITSTVGKFDLHTGTTPGGVPYTIAVDPTQRTGARLTLRKLPSIVDYYSSVYGTYPWGSSGAIIDNAPRVGYALETVTRPLFDSAPNELTLAHEIAHQWYGDDVTLRHWRDIWLNEGFAEFSAWLWDEHRGRMSAAQHLDQLMSLPPSSGIWNPPPGNPGDAAHIFSGSVYERGAGTLQALREKVGDTVFFRIMRGWVAAHRYGNATVPSFTKFAEGVSGRDLTTFFHEWLYRVGKPYSTSTAAASPSAIERR